MGEHAGQEMEATAQRSGCWEMLQRGIAMLTQAGPLSLLLVQALRMCQTQLPCPLEGAQHAGAGCSAMMG